MSDVALFELDEPVWASLYHPRGPWEDRGESALKSTAEEWKAYQRSQRCRDCGTLLSKCGRASSCGGGDRSGIFDLCDDCAALDGCREWLHDPTVVRRRRENFTVDQVAECSCGWFILDRLSDGGISAEEVLDTIATHVSLTHASRWGFSHTSTEHERLTQLQAARRAKYLREVAA